MMRRCIFVLMLAFPILTLSSESTLPDSQFVLLKNESPLIAFRILFLTGSADDPSGKEGLASLTASLLAKGSTRRHSYEKILQLQFPMATSYSAQVDKEMTVFSGVTHRDNVLNFYGLLRDAILKPAFDPQDFHRTRQDQSNFVEKTLRFNDDEELGKEVLNWAIFRNHPYGRPNAGTVRGNAALTIEDVKQFYGKH